MEGVDAITFAGGLGENTADLRENICKKFSFLGVELDEEANEKAIKGKEAEITKPGSKIRVFVIPTNEELLIARDTKEIVTALVKA